MPESFEKELVLVLGGARSGKSSWALRYAEEHYDSYLFIATAKVLDDEMADRIRLHKISRGPKWKLIEETIKIVEALETKCAGVEAVLIDCLTIWLSNVLYKVSEEQILSYQDRLLNTLSRKGQNIIIVANEVGTGIVPEYPLGREFRDLAGVLNQKIAKLADKVVFMIAGLPMCLKGDVITQETGARIQETELLTSDFKAPTAKEELEVTPEMSPEQIWSILSQINEEGLFIKGFNSLDDTKRRELAEYVLTRCNIFSGKGSIFSERYNSESGLLE